MKLHRWWLLAAVAGMLIVPLVWTGRPAAGFQPEPGYTALLKGGDLTGWRLGSVALDGMKSAPNQGWSMAEEILTAKGGSGALDTAAAFDRDFTLKLEFRVEEGAGGGLGIRGPCFPLRDYAKGGPPQYARHARPVGQWNELEVHVHNERGVLRVNGRPLSGARLEADLETRPPQVKVDGKPVKGAIEFFVLPAAEVKLNGQVVETAFRVPLHGVLSLQSERGKVEYRRLRYREFPAATGEPSAQPAPAPSKSAGE